MIGGMGERENRREENGEGGERDGGKKWERAGRLVVADRSHLYFNCDYIVLLTQ